MSRRLPPPPARKPAAAVNATDEAQYRRALQCYTQGHHDEAFAICERLRARPALQGRACLLLGCIHLLRKQAAAAEAALQVAVQKLGSAEAWFNLALAFVDGNKPAQAEEAYCKSLQLDPRQPKAWNNLGNLLHHGHDRERRAQALDCYRRAIALQPGYAHAHANLGHACQRAGQKEEAERHHRKALELAPDFVPALTNLAELLNASKRPDEALALYRKAWELDPGQISRMADFVQQRRRMADWSGADGPQPADLIAAIQNDQSGAAITPLPLLAWPEAWPQLLRDTAAAFARSKWRYELSQPPLASQVADTRGRRIRVGYLSADFRNHPIAHLLTDVIAQHDRARFEVFLYAYGPETEDAQRQALRRAAEHFTSVSALSDRAAAEKIRADGIDLLVDLTGYTTHARLGISALRPAAVIASWLGYVGSLGEPRLADYIIGDAVATPPERACDFSESLALMSHCFQPNQALTALPVPDRRAEGLPDDAFVFCSFNQCFKLTPTLWDDWCRILSSAKGSVLWLAPMNPVACDNLRREASRRGVAPDRLVFAKWRSLPEHQARVALADLSLDTWPYNSGTTASDVLRVGVPLLTVRGDTLAGCMGASLLHSLGLDELIAKDRAAYIDLAVALAADKARLHALRITLASRLRDSPLFDPRRFARDLERLFEAMLAQRARGETGVARA